MQVETITVSQKLQAYTYKTAEKAYCSTDACVLYNNYN